MQTFLPYPNFVDSAAALDNKRLGKQRIETKQIYTALTTGKGWIYHPATKMWRGHEGALLTYGYVMCIVWRNLGFKDSLLDFFVSESDDFDLNYENPPWVGDERLHNSHKSNLYRKDPEHYSQFAYLGPDLPYFWPTKEDYAYMLDAPARV